MLTLTLSVLLDRMSVDFCTLMEKEKDIVKSALIAYSYANEKYGPENVRKVISDANHLQIKTLAVSSVITKCPNSL